MALDAHIVNEMRQSGNNNNGGGVRWVALVEAGTYKWTLSASGTTEYYVELDAGGDPSLTEPNNVTTDGTYQIDTNGTLGSLNAGEWDWGDNDALGYSTVYVRLDDGADPDTKNDKYVSMVFGGGTDYSQQDSAQLSLTDLAMTTATTTLTSVTGGFTAAMVGNLIQITAGTNFTTGWYEITARSDTNTVTIDRDATTGSNASSGTGAVGGAMALPVDAFFESWTAGNRLFIKAGTYTLTGDISIGNSGTTTAVMIIEGYNTTRGDAPTGTNRPLIAAAANLWSFNDHWHQHNLRGTITTTGGFDGDRGTVFANCKVENSSGSANRRAFNLSTSKTAAYDCEAISTNGDGIEVTTDSGMVYGCYAHDSPIGIQLSTGDCFVSFNIVDTCSTAGIQFPASSDSFATNNNTAYNNGIGIRGGRDFQHMYNNQLISNAVGIEHNALREAVEIDYNNYFGNTKDVINTNKGPNATANDPGFTDAPGGDFSVGSGETPNGFGIRLGVGATPSTIHQGAYQPAGGAGGGRQTRGRYHNV